MHHFKNLIHTGTTFTLKAFDETHAKILKELQVTGSSSALRNLQMIEFQKAIMTIGMFSLFESILQQELNCANGFRKAKELLKKTGDYDLLDRFNTYYFAINVLKHGKGLSYDKLLAKSDQLPFEIKSENQSFFNEGDVDEVATYIKVDNAFVLNCSDLIQQVANSIIIANDSVKE